MRGANSADAPEDTRVKSRPPNWHCSIVERSSPSSPAKWHSMVMRPSVFSFTESAKRCQACEVMCSALWLFARRSTIVSPDAAVLLSAAALLSVAALPPPQAHRLSAVAKLKIAAIVLFILFSLRNSRVRTDFVLRSCDFILPQFQLLRKCKFLRNHCQFSANIKNARANFVQK